MTKSLQYICRKNIKLYKGHLQGYCSSTKLTLCISIWFAISHFPEFYVVTSPPTLIIWIESILKIIVYYFQFSTQYLNSRRISCLSFNVLINLSTLLGHFAWKSEAPYFRENLFSDSHIFALSLFSSFVALSGGSGTFLLRPFHSKTAK